MALAALAALLSLLPIVAHGHIARHGVAQLTNNEAARNAHATLHVASLNASQPVECYRHLKRHPSQIDCPDSCPFLRAEPTRMCEFKCVLAKDCSDDNPLANFANPETRRCEACLVPACESCSNTSKRFCSRCHDGFHVLPDGSCVKDENQVWHCIYAGIGVLLLVIVVWAIQLFRRDIVNLDVLIRALDFRYISSIRNPGSGSQYSLVATDMRHDCDVAGQGTMLHFRWMYLVTLAAFLMMAPCICLSLIWAQRSSLEHVQTLESRHTFNACEENVRRTKRGFADMEGLYFTVILIIYISWIVGSVIYFKFTIKSWKTGQSQIDTMGQFAMLACGFPVLSGSENVEKDFEAFLRSAPQLKGMEIIGVSVCWNYGREKLHEINAHTNHLLGLQEGRNSPEELSKSKTLYSEEFSKRTCCDPELRCIDAALGFGSLPCAESGVPEDLPDIHAVLDNLKTTEHVFVVFGKVSDAVKAKKSTDEMPLEYKGAKVTLHDHEYEPMTVNWQGWGCSVTEHHVRLALGWVIIFVTVMALDVFFYLPYVQYIMSYSDVSGLTQGGFVTGTMLGLLITVCNQIIYQVIQFVAQSCGWTDKGKEMRFYVFQYTLAVLFNTCVDLWTVVILARGYAVDEAIQFQAASDTTMGAKAIAEQPSIQKALYVQIVAYIFPSCLLLPFLLEPLATVSVPYALFTRLVGSRREVVVQDAEESLAYNPYDLSRYGDVLVNLMLCCIMFGFTYPGLWMIWMYFIISMVVIYAWDKLRVLRFSKRSYFSSMTMDIAVQYMATMPCGVLAACLVFRMYGAKRDGFIDSMMRSTVTGTGTGGRRIISPFLDMMSRHNITWICLAVFFLHTLLHCLLLRCFDSRAAGDEEHDVLESSDADLEERAKSHSESYASVSRFCPDSFFTTNPVHCLRSKYKYTATDNPPCSFLEVGRPNLIKTNKKLGIYYSFANTTHNIPSYSERNEPLEIGATIARFVDGHGHKGVFKSGALVESRAASVLARHD